MKRQSPRQREDDQRIAERAAEWLDVLQAGGTAERTEFAEWIAASPRHAEEFLLMSALARELKTIDLDGFERVRTVFAEDATKVVALSGSPATLSILRQPVETAPLPRVEHRNVMKHPSRWAAGIAGLAILAGLAWWTAAENTYSTAVGKQRTVRLEDGSVVYLNTASRVRVNLTKTSREVALLAGEALFVVAQERDRPFRVASAGTIIQAVGTSFNVRRGATETEVSVIEGRVRVEGKIAASAHPAVTVPQLLAAGEELTVRADGRIDRKKLPDIAQTVAWRERQLVFLSDTLADIAAEFNRYNRSPRLAIRDKGAGARRYSGVFSSDDPQSLIAFLREDTQLKLEQRGDELEIWEVRK